MALEDNKIYGLRCTTCQAIIILVVKTIVTIVAFIDNLLALRRRKCNVCDRRTKAW